MLLWKLTVDRKIARMRRRWVRIFLSNVLSVWMIKFSLTRNSFKVAFYHLRILTISLSHYSHYLILHAWVDWVKRQLKMCLCFEVICSQTLQTELIIGLKVTRSYWHISCTNVCSKKKKRNLITRIQQTFPTLPRYCEKGWHTKQLIGNYELQGSIFIMRNNEEILQWQQNLKKEL